MQIAFVKQFYKKSFWVTKNFGKSWMAYYSKLVFFWPTMHQIRMFREKNCFAAISLALLWRTYAQTCAFLKNLKVEDCQYSQIGLYNGTLNCYHQRCPVNILFTWYCCWWYIRKVSCGHEWRHLDLWIQKNSFFSILLMKDLSWLMNIELYIKTLEQVMQ